MKKYALVLLSFLCLGLMANAQTVKDIFTPEVVKQMNSALPQQIEEGVSLDNIFIEDNYFGMTIGIDEKVMKMSDVRSEFSSVSGVELAQLMFSDDPTVPKLLVMLNVGLKMVFVSQQTGEKYIRTVGVQDFAATYSY